MRNSCLLLLLAFCCISHCSSALKSATVVGTVYCDTCFQHKFATASHFIAGASVVVECRDHGTAKPFFTTEAKTKQKGVFRVRLPLSISKHIDNIKSCSVKLSRSNEPSCAVASSATSAGLRLKSKRNGLHVFSAGYFAFKPPKKPELCSSESDASAEQKPARPAFFFFPPIPFIPSPGILPPNPLVPPPSLIPPVIPSPPPSILPPIIPSAPPSIVPPIFPTPPPSLLPPVPNLPIPFLTPPPPPPASIFPPFPIPFPPSPLFPGNPPASHSP